MNKMLKTLRKRYDKYYFLLLNKWMSNLVICLIILFIVGIVCAGIIKGWSLKIFDFACGYLFDSSQASGNLFTWLIFIIAWLFGDGILITIIGKYYVDWLNGDFRRNPNLVENHIVVLGWDNGILAELIKITEKEKKDIYVITRQKASDLRKYLQNAGLNNIVVYNGDYDNEVELNDNLKISEACQVFIAGELDEDAHDARVILLCDKLTDKNSPIVSVDKIKVNIHDFGLAWQLSERKNFENFHLKWAEFLWHKLNIPESISGLELFIVGFGAMGKSVVLTIPEWLKTTNPIIVVTDDDGKKLKEEKERYDKQFYDNDKDGKVLKVTDWEWSDALRKMQRPISNDKYRVIVVAKKRSEKGMFCMMDIIDHLHDPNDSRLKLALSQEIDGYLKIPEEEMNIKNAKIRLFGMKKGVQMTLEMLAKKNRNPYAPLLRKYAFEKGTALVNSCGISGARYVLGGSLGYDAALVGGYDIDLRLLIPDAGKSVEEVRREIDAVKDMMVVRAKGNPTFEVWFIDEGGKSYIWHTKQIVKVPGIPGNPDVELSWNIQAESSYRGIAEIASKLPQDIKDRYVIAKGKAREESNETYRALKKQWMDFIERLIDQGAREMGEKELENLLTKAGGSVTKFLK